MPVLHHSETDDVSSVDDSEDEEGTGFWGSFKPAASARVENPYPASGPLPGVVLSATAGVTPAWAVVGKTNPKPVKLNQAGIHDIFYHLLNVHMAPFAGKAVAGDGVCIGLTFKSSSFVHPKTQRSREFIDAVFVAEIRSHNAFDKILLTSIQINHNTISAPHTDNNLVGTPSIAMGLGDYVGGRLRLDGAKQPLNIRDHAVIFDGRKIHSSGIFNGDRWSMVLFVHSSWVDVTPAMRAQLIWVRISMSPNRAYCRCGARRRCGFGAS